VPHELPESTPPMNSLARPPIRTQRSRPLARPAAPAHVTFGAHLRAWRFPWPAVWAWLGCHTFVPSCVPARWRHPAVGYALALAVQVVGAFVTRRLILAFPSFAFPGIIEVLTVTLIALSWGAGPGVFAAVAGLVLDESIALPARVGEGPLTKGDLIEGMIFLAVGICITVVATMTEGARRRAVEERAEARALVMQQTQDRMDEFLAIASHDLRSPLTALSGFIGLATRSYTSLASSVLDTCPDLAAQIERVRKDLDMADESSERLHRLVEVLFDTSRARLGTLDVAPAPCDLAALVREQVAALQASAPQRTVELEEPGGGPMEVMADADRIGEVIMNYLTNVLKYSPASQPMRIRVGIADGRARVAVQDHGPGLPASEQERIWQPFYRAKGVQAQSDWRGSLGLGLHVCKRIVEGHGGTVGVHSEAGHGSTFWFELPLAEESARPVACASRPGYDHRVVTPARETDADKRGGTDAGAR
jgi:signal transduction histidine kinase